MRKLNLVGAVAVLAMAGGVHGQNLEWGFIATAGDPDTVSVFDVEDPMGTVTTLGQVDGNFNRGMDFVTPDSFYYFVSTDTLNDPGDRGLWFYDEGSNTQLATIPFSDSSDGDATYDPSTGTFYVTVDDDDATDGDSLYAFTNLNGTPSFTEIGETGLSQIFALAVNPVTGDMFGYDSTSEALYSIDKNDGSATLIGASGLSLGTIGGMDFSEDGSTLLLSQGDDFYYVDPSDGSFSFIEDIGTFNTSALSYRMGIPAPGTAALLGLAGFTAARRRR